MISQQEENGAFTRQEDVESTVNICREQCSASDRFTLLPCDEIISTLHRLPNEVLTHVVVRLHLYINMCIRVRQMQRGERTCT
jgi:hypothetical protein